MRDADLVDNTPKLATLPTGRRKAKVTCDLTIATIQASHSRMCEGFAPGENLSTKFFVRWTRGTPSPGRALPDKGTLRLSEHGEQRKVPTNHHGTRSVDRTAGRFRSVDRPQDLRITVMAREVEVSPFAAHMPGPALCTRDFSHPG
jgi:hypothetical protein